MPFSKFEKSEISGVVVIYKLDNYNKPGARCHSMGTPLLSSHHPHNHS